MKIFLLITICILVGFIEGTFITALRIRNMFYRGTIKIDMNSFNGVAYVEKSISNDKDGSYVLFKLDKKEDSKC